MTTERYAEHLAYMRQYRRKRIAQGLCTNCGELNDRRPLTRCAECARVEILKNDLEPLPLCRCGRRRVYRATGKRECWRCRKEVKTCG